LGSTLSEQLGFAADERIAIVHADDIGMCRAANRGAFAALAAGPMTSGSLMVPCPAFAEAAELARSDRSLDLGVHLTLNAEHEHHRWGPIAGARNVPSLVDADGFLHRTSAEALARARPDEVEVELRAQIETALEAGIDVTHLDGHMGTAFLPPLLDVYARLLREYRVPGPLVRLEASTLPPVFGHFADRLDAVVAELEADGFPVLTALEDDSLRFAPGGGEAHNAARLDSLGPGIHYLITHPAEAGEELSAITPDAHCRAFEAEFYGSHAGHAALAARGIATLGMRPLRDRLRA
jgi:predicted glycoside hydrolase/deacetylase ChbG (UPF0249 family)